MTALMQSPQAAPAARSIVMRGEHLFKAFDGVHVLRDLSFRIQSGDVVLLRGENGSGKTTLINILTGHLKPDKGELSLIDDRLRFHFPALDAVRPARFEAEAFARLGVARTWQDVRLFESLTVLDNVAAAALAPGGDNPIIAVCRPEKAAAAERSAQKAALDWLQVFDLVGQAQSLGDALSVGQAKRTAIARALAGGASVVFLDEPLAGLDARGVRSVLTALKKLVRTHRITLVIVEHALNYELIRPLVTHEWLLEAGRIHVRPAPAPADADDRESAAAVVPTWASPLLTGRDGYEATPLPRGAFLVHARAPAGSVLLTVKDFGVRRGGRNVLARKDGGSVLPTLRLRAGEVIFLEAPNGWGKTSLLEAVAGLIPASAGLVRFVDEDITNARPHLIRRKGIAFVAARANVYPDLAVGEALALADAERGPLLGDIASGRHVSSLSGGERQRLALACALYARTPPRVLLLDEPLSFLDANAVGLFLNALAAHHRCGVLIALPSSRPVQELEA